MAVCSPPISVHRLLTENSTYQPKMTNIHPIIEGRGWILNEKKIFKLKASRIERRNPIQHVMMCDWRHLAETCNESHLSLLKYRILLKIFNRT